MLITCISASNIKHAGDSSTSLKICKIIKHILQSTNCESIDVEVIPLVNYELKPCIGCGGCFKQDECIHDEDFNRIYQTLIKSNALFFVAAHYAPIPSKLSILLEKVEQLAFLKRFNNEDYRSPLYKKPAGIIGHGGGTEEIIKYYKEPILDSIWNALSYPVEMSVIGVDYDNPNGIILPISVVKKVQNSIFPIQEYNWEDIESRLKPLVSNVVKKIQNQNNPTENIREL